MSVYLSAHTGTGTGTYITTRLVSLLVFFGDIDGTRVSGLRYIGLVIFGCRKRSALVLDPQAECRARALMVTSRYGTC